jgi:hypothetical protein
MVVGSILPSMTSVDRRLSKTILPLATNAVASSRGDHSGCLIANSITAAAIASGSLFQIRGALADHPPELPPPAPDTVGTTQQAKGKIWRGDGGRTGDVQLGTFVLRST